MRSAASEEQGAAWFSCLGSPLTRGDLADSSAYLDALGYPPELPTVCVESWVEAERIVRAPDWDSAWWEREEQEREVLKAKVERRLGSMHTLKRLTAATDVAADAIHAAAILAMARNGSGADGMVRAASGAAIMAAHEFALAQLAASGSDHLFVRKYTLFKSGRWPLGVLRGAFHLF